jgi:nucleoside-diphosphate-sugar epimerase
MKNILVTGVAGFIGHGTAKRLLKEGKKVIGIDNMNDYYDIRLKRHRLDSLNKYKNFIFYQKDIEHLSEIEEIFRNHKIDGVINLAARAGVRYSIENPHVYMSTNAHGTLNLLELMRKYSVKKFVLASTSSLYAGQPMPFYEDLPVNKPISPYAATKKAAEVLSYTYHYLYGIDVSVLRYFTVYGPAGRPDMSIFRFIKWIDEGLPLEIYGDGSQSRDFTYIDDISYGTILALKDLGYEIINLGGGMRPASLTEVIKKLERLLGKKAKIQYNPFHKADITKTQADISKAKKILGWETKTCLEEGLKKTVQWYEENRHWLKDIKL